MVANQFGYNLARAVVVSRTLVDNKHQWAAGYDLVSAIHIVILRLSLPYVADWANLP